MQYIFLYFLLWLITLFAWIYWFFLYKYFLFSRYSLIFFQLHLLSQFYMDDSLLFLLFLTLLLHTLFHLLHSMWPGELEKKILALKKNLKNWDSVMDSAKLNKFILSHNIIYIKQRNKKGVIMKKNINLKEKYNKKDK